MRLRVILGSSLLTFGVSVVLSAEQGVINSERSACSALMLGAVKYRLSAHDLTGRYYCSGYDSERYPKGYFVLGLRYRARQEEKVGSNLIGWFAIRKADGALFELDLDGTGVKPLRQPSEWKK
jgi:hypothetical protein